MDHHHGGVAEQMLPPESVKDALDDLSDWRYLARGGFSSVWVASEAATDRLVAVKVLDGTLDPSGRRRFELEAAALGRLSGHPNIVSVYRAGVTEGGIGWLVMEYASGGTCDDLLRGSGPLPWPRAVELMLAVTDALAAAHEAGLLHLDVKPSNVLISSFGTAKLADFGLVRPETLSDTATLEERRLTPHHASPEMIRGDPPSPRSDVWSATSTLFQLLDGRPPFAASGEELPSRVMRRIETDPPRPLAVDGPTDQLAVIVDRGLAKNPAKRFSSAEDLHACLLEVGRPHESGSGHPARSGHSLRVSAVAVGVVLAVIAAAFMWWIGYGRGPSGEILGSPPVHSWFITSETSGSVAGSLELTSNRIDGVGYGWPANPPVPAGGRLWGPEYTQVVSGQDFHPAGVSSLDRQGNASTTFVPSELGASGPFHLFASGTDAPILWVTQTIIPAEVTNPEVTHVWRFDATTGTELGRTTLAGSPNDLRVPTGAFVGETLYLPWADKYGRDQVARFSADGMNPSVFDLTRMSPLDDEGRPGVDYEHLRLAAGTDVLYAVAEDGINGLMRFWDLDPETMESRGEGIYELIAAARPMPPVVVDDTAYVLVGRSFRQVDGGDDRSELIGFGRAHEVESRRIDVPSGELPPVVASWRPLADATRLYMPLWIDGETRFGGLTAVDVVSGDAWQFRSPDKQTEPPLEVLGDDIALGVRGEVVVLEASTMEAKGRSPARVDGFWVTNVAGRAMRLDRSNGSVALLDSAGSMERTWTTGLEDANFLVDTMTHDTFLVGSSDGKTFSTGLSPETGPGPLREVDQIFTSLFTVIGGGTTWASVTSQDRNGFQQYTNFNKERFLPTDAALLLPKPSLQPLTWDDNALYVLLDTRRGPTDPLVVTHDPLCPLDTTMCLQRIPLDGTAVNAVALSNDVTGIEVGELGLLVATLSGFEVRDPRSLQVLRTGIIPNNPATSEPATSGPSVAGHRAGRIYWYQPRSGRFVVADATTMAVLTTFDAGEGSSGRHTWDPDQIWYLPVTGGPTGVDLATMAPLGVSPTPDRVIDLAAASGRIYIVTSPQGDVTVGETVAAGTTAGTPPNG